MLTKTGSGKQESNSKKKLVIKPFKSQPRLPDNFEEKTWSILEQAVRAVNSETPTSIGKEELYRAVEDLCLHKLSASTYEKLERECESYINKKVDSLISDITDQQLFLEQVDYIWTNHCDHMRTIRNIFLYLDRSYPLQTTGVRPLWELGIYLFRRRFEYRQEVEAKCVVALLSAVEAERQGQTVDKALLQRVLHMFTTLDIYTDKFEAPFLSSSRSFFLTEGQILIEREDISSFLVHTERRLQQAIDMVNTYLDVNTRRPLVEVVETCLLHPHCTQLIDRGAQQLFEEGRITDLKRTIILLDRVKESELLKTAWNEFIRRTGEALVKDTTRDKTLIDDLLALQDRLDNILKNAFNNQDSFRSTLKTALEHVISVRAKAPAELLAKYLDKKMRGEKGVTDNEMESVLDKSMILFQRLQSKDIFEAFYKKSLAKRLLLGKSANWDLEKFLISKLKAECGANFTAKMEGMFGDVELSKTAMLQYTQWLAENNSPSMDAKGEKSSVEVHYQVLTTGFWPSYPQYDVTVPSELQHQQSLFMSFYGVKFQGRRLVWQHVLDRCVMTVRFPKGKKELELSFFQTIVLLCFKNTNRLTVPEIRTETKLEDGELKRTIQSLACGVVGTRVLIKEPKGKDVMDTDVIIFNEDFTNKLFRIRINTIQLKDTEEETEKTHEEIFRDRQYQVDAAVVRIMKARKRTTHNTLMAELLAQIKFPARPVDLKKRIESLIEREYLEREKDDPSTYVYLA